MNYADEARLFCKYLLKQEATDSVVKRYGTIMRSTPIPKISSGDAKALRAVQRYPFLLPLYDSGLALVRSESELRRRLYILISILEATPEYSDKFLATNRSPFYIISIIFSGIIAVLQSILGVLLVKVSAR